MSDSESDDFALLDVDWGARNTTSRELDDGLDAGGRHGAFRDDVGLPDPAARGGPRNRRGVGGRRGVGRF